ncbi:hypothetical protein C8Q76DRAFT_794654 [Earliella scabrosa]|nr:hypothetical protein C8Q76DRAFT_794654 [Earliella scabrosa]
MGGASQGSRLVSYRSDLSESEAAVTIDRIQQATGTNFTIIFRDAVSEDSGEISRPAAEPVFRWTNLHPSIVFDSGFIGGANISDDTPLDTKLYNVAAQLTTKGRQSSIFVSAVKRVPTVTPSIPSESDSEKLVSWRPSRRSKALRVSEFIFEYEILAHGGIDVNATLNKSFPHEQIAFPGGIRRQFIRAAREWRGSQPVRLWVNPYFDNTANRKELSPPQSKLPALFRAPPGNSSTPGGNVMFYLPSEKHEAIKDDFLSGPGEIGDPYGSLNDYESDHPDDEPPFKDVKRAVISVASFTDPVDDHRAYVFYGNRFTHIHVPDDRGKKQEGLSHIIKDSWPSLESARRGHLDAVLLDAGDKSEGRLLHVFWARLHASIRFQDSPKHSRVVKGPAEITARWPSLKEAKFKTVDAVLPLRNSTGTGPPARKVYVFSGEHYVLITNKIESAESPNSGEDSLIEGPKSISGDWSALKNAGFKSVDTVLLCPLNPARAYFFCGDHYVLASVTPGNPNVFGKGLIKEDWPSLVKAGFW